jgi:non-specific serine/threonine protein kinase
LPRELTSFIGREHELDEVASRLAEAVLVTVAGPGGAGKTRLVLRLARHLLDQGTFADGVVLVELAPLTDPRLVVDAIAESLDVPEPQGIPLVEVLVRSVRNRHVLLVLDNCEHVLAACADVASRLLRDCPGVRLLATSREPLHVLGEVVFRIPPLGLPGDDGLESLSAHPIRRRSPRSAADWTGCRWRSSSPRRAWPRLRRPTSPTNSTMP